MPAGGFTEGGEGACGGVWGEKRIAVVVVVVMKMVL